MQYLMLFVNTCRYFARFLSGAPPAIQEEMHYVRAIIA
ncbi:hypothetical protein AC26_3005 [Escherichia coli 1-176-05_S3_C2]|nr:hypothetical protein AC26_3005 [Escherichia coli 1-176-05_S3_C2]